MISFHFPSCSIHTPTQNPPGALDISEGDPSNDPPSDDPNFNFDSSNTSDTEDADPAVIFTNLAKTINSVAESSYSHPLKTLQCTKVQELDQFDKTDLCKLWVFLMQCKLNFHNHP